MQTTLAQFNETASTDSFAMQNSKLLKVSLSNNTIQAKAGSMVAYQGQVAFEHAGSGGMGRMLKKAVTGEGTKLMKMSGTGEVFLADTAQDIHLIYLEGEKITVNGPNLLAFDADIDWDIERVQGASGMMGGGLYNTSLKTDVNLKSLIGKSSGETFQMAFSGQGWVLVQPSEGRPQFPAAGGGGGGLGSLLNG